MKPLVECSKSLMLSPFNRVSFFAGMLLLSLFFFSQLALCEFSFIFPNVTDPDELVRTHEFYQPSPLVDSVANLGIRALTDLLSTTHSNVVISPLNIFSCLDILHLGAAGKTAEEIGQIVGNAKNEDAVNHILNTLHGTTHASSVFLDRDIVPKEKFVLDSYREYQTEIINVDFADSLTSTSVINGWVAEKTNGTIQEIVQGGLDPATKVVVVSALFFCGKWLHPFSPLVTENGKFEIDKDNFINVPMMHLEAYLPVVKRTNYNAIGLHYKEGGLMMYVILPNRHGLEELKRVLYSFSPTDLKSFSQSAVNQTTFIEIPKFKINARVCLKDALVRQGMHTSFDPVHGNFTNFSENKVDGIFISDVYHSVHIEVNEHETIASAASAAIFTKSRSFNFKATRPFIFAIADSTGLLLFTGVVLRPE